MITKSSDQIFFNVQLCPRSTINYHLILSFDSCFTLDDDEFGISIGEEEEVILSLPSKLIACDYCGLHFCIEVRHLNTRWLSIFIEGYMF